MVEEAKKAEENYLVFEAGGLPLAVRISQVRRVLEKTALDPGMEILDLAKILNLKLKSSALGLEVIARNKTSSVLVDRVEPIKDLRLAVWLDFPRLMRRKNNRMIKGFFFDGSRMISLIDFEEIN